MSNGRLESKVTVPAGGWTVAINDGGGADNAVIPAGDYFPAEFFAAFKTVADTATGRTHTFTVADGESGTGILTWTISSASSVAFTSTDARDYMGYTGNLSSGTSHVGTNGVQAMWLPGCPIGFATDDDFHPDESGVYEDDSTHNEGPTGTITTWVGSTKRAFQNVTWSHVDEDHAIDNANTTVVSFQRWVRQTQRGGLSYFPITSAGLAPLVRFIANADSDTVVGAAVSGDGVYRLILPRRLNLPRPSAGWVGLHTVTIPRMVKV